ncbi:uncharacterized protein LOC117816051 [Notolabrus celidotus]|uniref:uncharacterized protein LOC117816051 n=1 Tax=Notolabrus celidotus TaxID=1203425 RepID=UPI001490431D|nr:uncharacterized protein LOC117816051 [Notolabrus celidotus]
MPQYNMNYEGRRRGTRPYSCKTNCQVNGQVPGTDLVNGVGHNGCPTAATKTSERTSNGTENVNRPQCMVNGHINHECKDYGGKRVPRRTTKKQGRVISAFNDASASGRVISAGVPGGVSVNGDAVALPCNSYRMNPEQSFKEGTKNRGTWTRFRHKKRGPKVKKPKIPISPPTAPQEEEDWEKDIKEITVTNWEKMSFGICPYGPDDLLSFNLRDLTLRQLDTVPPPVTAEYNPAARHPRPLKWSHYNIPTEPEQFADADE